MNSYVQTIVDNLLKKKLPELATLFKLYADSHEKLREIEHLIQGRTIVDADEIREILK